MIIYMPWHNLLIAHTDHEIRSILHLYLDKDYRLPFFNDQPSALITYYLTQNLRWLHSQYYKHGSRYLSHQPFPAGWKVYRFELIRGHS